MAGKRLELVEDLDALEQLLPQLTGARSVTLTLSPQSCVHFGADRIAGIFRAANIDNWGVLSGLGLPEASRLIARLAARRPATQLTGALYCGFQSAERSPRLERLFSQDVDEQPMPLKIAGPAKSLTYFRGHGRSHCGLDGNICTKSSASAAGDTVCSGQSECMFPSFDRRPAREFALDFCVLDVCAPGAFRPRGPGADEGFNLALHLQAGSATCVLAPYRYHSSAGFSPYLTWHLAQRGATAGEIQQALNAYFETRFDQHPPYLLLGDPDMRIAEPATPSPEAASLHADNPVIEVSPGMTRFYVLDGAWPAEPTLHSDETGLFTRSLAERVEIDGTKGLMVAWDKAAPAGVHRLDRLNRTDEGRLTAEGIKQWLTNAARLPIAKEEPVTALTEALTTATRFESFYAGAQSAILVDGGLHKLERDISTSLTGLLDSAGRELLDDFRKRAAVNDAWLPVDLAQNSGMSWVSSRLSGDCCPHCDGLLLTRTYRVGFFNPVLREVKECEHHLLVSDRPQSDPLGDLRFDCPETAPLGRPFELAVTGRNDAAYPVHLLACVSIVRQQVDPSDIVIAPDIQSVVIEPGQRFDLMFDLTLGQTAWAMGHNVQAILLCNGGAISLYRQVQFTRN
ncbi:MAG: hypothetical protein QNJ09_02400 [Paracoccaceae bacterium]|nr:hypothetical protein [Paracoccaceae bacterium]